ncbi:MAG: cytochrome b/b6 domain-containing protein, partial [Smithellaceae bacterium]|nr:cytochrome b/b6 domain-containing protein [Smithellaceae bacterium]
AAGAFFLLAFDRVLLFVKRVFTFSLDDVRWFAVLGGYPQKLLLGRKISVPPMGKYNSGQKLFGICVLIGGAVLIISGLALWAFPHLLPRAATAYLGLLHTFFGWLLTLFLPVHLFLGVYMADDFKAMILHGRIPLAEAREMSPCWVEKEVIALSENG